MADNNPPLPQPARLTSLDAYRGFIMLAMASSGLGFVQVANNAEDLQRYSGTGFDAVWQGLWRFLAYQFDHVAWTGCGFWDLIQPSFMFMVGVAVPFSYARRTQQGQPWIRQFVHVLWRSAILVVLGVLLSSKGRQLTNFTFVNVLTQIGLGYPFLYLLCEKPGSAWSTRTWLWIQATFAAAILVGYGAWFAWYQIPNDELAQVQQYIEEVAHKDSSEWSQFDGWAAHWNKHTNAAAAADRKLLNLVPRQEPEWPPRDDSATEGASQVSKRFWINTGGYQTLNFIPSLATMIFGLMAGHILRGPRTPNQKFLWLVIAGGICFAIVLPIDTTIWPASFSGWTLCPSVKRIWTPTWAVFSSGWTLWMLAAFYWVIDVRGWKRWSWPLVVVGMNSIAIYCMSQLMREFTKSALNTNLSTIDAWLGWSQGVAYYLFDPSYAFSPIFERLAVLFVFWLICVWMYRQKIFIRI